MDHLEKSRKEQNQLVIFFTFIDFCYRCQCSAVTITVLLFLVPSGPPSHIQTEAESSTSIQLSWRAPDFYNINGIIQNYFIKFISVKKSGENVQVGNVSTPTNNTTYLINQLWKYTKYNITVQAVNQVGKGPTGLSMGTTLQDGKNMYLLFQ